MKKYKEKDVGDNSRGVGEKGSRGASEAQFITRQEKFF
jgi:hypothetical protein